MFVIEVSPFTNNINKNALHKQKISSLQHILFTKETMASLGDISKLVHGVRIKIMYINKAALQPASYLQSAI